MSRSRLALVAGLLFAMPGSSQAQDSRPLPAAIPPRFESWQAPGAFTRDSEPAAGRIVTISPNRTRQALLGGAIGAVAGVVFCTAISTLANDSADGGLSFCPLDSYLLIGGAGFALGAVIGWVS